MEELFDTGIIYDLADNIALAYTGDLFDNRPHSLRLLQAMVHLKNKNFNKVIIVGGNRDFNKLRLGMELFVNIKNENGEINSNIFDGTITFDTLLEQNFEFKMTQVPEYWNHPNWKSPKDPKPQIFTKGNDNDIFTTKNIQERIDFIMTETMGIPGKAYITEIKEIFNITDDDKTYKLICLLFMAMCFNWEQKFLISDDDIKGKLFNSFKGILYHYLEMMNTIAYFQLGTKTGFLSHSGMLEKGITAPLGYEPKSAGVSVHEFMPHLYNDKLTMLMEYDQYKHDKNGDIINKDHFMKYGNFIRYIAITVANVYDKHSPIIAGPGINSSFDVKVGGTSPYEIMKTIFPIEYNYTEKNMFSLLTTTGKNVTYNIFGHNPNFIFPIVTQIESGTKHVGLDICRTDFGVGGQNNYSFALLEINSKGTDFILGRSKFGDVKNTDETRSKLENKIVYYYNKIDDFKKILDTKAIDINKVLPLEFKNKYKLAPRGFNRYIEETRQDSTEGQTEKSIGTGGKKRSRKKRHKKRATHKKSKSCKTRKHKIHKHKCTALCKKCHKHDHKCMLKCRLCHQQHKSHKHKRH